MKYLKLQIIILITICLILPFFFQCAKSQDESSKNKSAKIASAEIKSTETKSFKIKPSKIKSSNIKSVEAVTAKNTSKNDLAKSYQRKGITLAGKLDYDDAIKKLTKAVKLDPKLISAHFYLGWSRERIKEYDKGIEDYTKVIELDPEHATAYVNRGYIWKMKKEYDKAIIDYNKCLELNPNYQRAYYNRGYVWQLIKEHDKAIKDFTKSIEINPRIAKVYRRRGNAWAEKKEYDKAIKDHTKAIEVNPEYALAFNERGYVWEKIKEYDKAIRDFGAAIRIDHEFTIALNSLAWLLATCPDSDYRDGKEAVYYASRAYKINSDNTNSDILAAAYAEAGDFKNAIKYQKEAIKKAKDEDKAKEQINEYTSRLELYKKKRPYQEKLIESTMKCVLCLRSKEKPLYDKMIYSICGKHWNTLIMSIDAMTTANEDLKKKLDKARSTSNQTNDKTFSPGDDAR